MIRRAASCCHAASLRIHRTRDLSVRYSSLYGALCCTVWISIAAVVDDVRALALNKWHLNAAGTMCGLQVTGQPHSRKL